MNDCKYKKVSFFHCLTMEQVINGGVPPAIPDLDIDPRYGVWDTHVIQEKLLLTHNVTDANVNEIYYFPVAYPAAMIQPEKLLELSDGLFYNPVSIDCSVENVNCQRDVKLTASDSTPLPINEIGIYFYDTTGNMLVADSQWPYAKQEHHMKMVHMIEKSLKKQRSELLPCTLLTNNYPDFGNAMTMAHSKVSVRDPNFKEKNNESETVFFKNTWTNDVGMRIHIQALLAPPRRNETRPYYVKQGVLWKKAPGTRSFEYITMAPFDYRKGYMTNPPGEDRVLSAYAKAQGKHNFAEVSLRAHNSATGTSVVAKRQTTAFGAQDSWEDNFTRAIAPYSPDQWMGASWRDKDSLEALLGKNGKEIWTKQLHEYYYNNTTPFSGNKNIKPFFMKFGPSWNGNNFQPYYCHFEFNCVMTVKVFRYQPFLERPVFPTSTPKTVYTAEEIRYAADMTYMQVEMHNPYMVEESTGPAEEFIPNAFNRQFVPVFQSMPISFKKTPPSEGEKEEMQDTVN